MTSEAVQGQGRCGQGSPEKGYNRKVLGVLFISILSCMVGVGIIAPLLPVYATEMGATGIWLGLIFAGFSVSRAISMPLISSGRQISLSDGLRYDSASSGDVMPRFRSRPAVYREMHASEANRAFCSSSARFRDHLSFLKELPIMF